MLDNTLVEHVFYRPGAIEVLTIVGRQVCLLVLQEAPFDPEVVALRESRHHIGLRVVCWPKDGEASFQ